MADHFRPSQLLLLVLLLLAFPAVGDLTVPGGGLEDLEIREVDS